MALILQYNLKKNLNCEIYYYYYYYYHYYFKSSCTVKPSFRGHQREDVKLAAKDGWLLIQSSIWLKYSAKGNWNVTVKTRFLLNQGDRISRFVCLFYSFTALSHVLDVNHLLTSSVYLINTIWFTRWHDTNIYFSVTKDIQVCVTFNFQYRQQKQDGRRNILYI